MTMCVKQIPLCFILVLLLCPNTGTEERDEETSNFTIYIGRKPGGDSDEKTTVSEKILPIPDKKKALNPAEPAAKKSTDKAPADKSHSKPSAVPTSPADFGEQEMESQTDSEKEDTGVKSASDQSRPEPLKDPQQELAGREGKPAPNQNSSEPQKKPQQELADQGGQSTSDQNRPEPLKEPRQELADQGGKTTSDRNSSEPGDKSPSPALNEQDSFNPAHTLPTQTDTSPSALNEQKKSDTEREGIPNAATDTRLSKDPQNAQIESPKEAANKNKVSETFAPAVKEEKTTTVWGLPEDYSLVFDSHKTKQELAIVPTFYRSRTYGFNWGIRVFTFSPDNSGYYFSTSLVNKLSTFLFKWDADYRQRKARSHRDITTYGQFSNYFEPYYEQKGMGTVYRDEKKLYSYKLNLRHRRIFRNHQPFFYGAEIGGFFLKQRPPYFDKDLRFETEFLIYLKLTGGYDSRKDWKNPDQGNHHQLALSCVPILGQNSSYCLIEGDFRTYIPLPITASGLRQSVLALRAFAGTSLIAPAAYSMAYTLGGSHILRGFTDRRFRGDKIYFGQSELRLPLWKNILSGVLFFELGEVAGFHQHLSGFLWDYGLGFRLGIPPSYNVKLRADLGVAPEKTGKTSYNFIINFLQAF